MSYRIELMSIGDTREVEHVGNKCLPIYYNAMDLLLMLLDINHILLKVISTKDTSIIGFIVAQKKHGGKRIHIKSIGILNNHRRKGLASKLIDYLKNKEGVEELTLYVVVDNYPALEFYSKQGFASVVQIENYYSSLGKNAYFLRWRNRKIDDKDIEHLQHIDPLNI